MIDAEQEIFVHIGNHLYESLPELADTLTVVDEYIAAPSSFPCVSLIEMDNVVYRNNRDSSEIENHVQVIYEVNVYSNKTKGRKQQCKEILACINDEMERLGFTRTVFTPVPNEADATIYRMVARYRAIIGKDHTIYQRR